MKHHLILKNYIFVILLVFVCSCKKQSDAFYEADNSTNDLKVLSRSESKTPTGGGGGGTIGCAITLVQTGNNDAYDNCMDIALSGRNKLGNVKIYDGPFPVTKPCYVCTIPSWHTYRDFWNFVGLSEVGYGNAIVPTGQISVAATLQTLKEEVFRYNSFLYKIFANANGEMEIPANNAERRNRILNYTGYGPNFFDVKAENLIYYSSLVYEDEHFEFPAIFDEAIFLTPDENGKTSLRQYGFKTVFF